MVPETVPLSISLSTFPQVELLALPKNIGFAVVNCNRALIRAFFWMVKCDYALLLNNHALIHTHALTELINVAGTQPQAGILGPEVYYDDGSQRIWDAGARRRSGVLAAADSGRGQLDRGQFTRCAKWITCLVRRCSSAVAFLNKLAYLTRITFFIWKISTFACGLRRPDSRYYLSLRDTFGTKARPARPLVRPCGNIIWSKAQGIF